MKTITKCLVAAILLFTSICFAQENDMDKIKLKNKTTYTGKLISQKPGESIRFVIQNTQDTISVNMNDIEEISKTKGPTEAKPINNTKASNPYNANSFQTALSYYEGGGDVRFQGFGLSIDYLKNSSFGLGLSVAYLGETGSSNNRPYQWQKIPLLFVASYDLQKYSNNRSAIYTKVGLGYSFTINGNYFEESSQQEISISNGFAFNPGFGYRFHITKGFGLKTDVSYLLIADQSKFANGNKAANLNWNTVVLKLSVFF
jgi:hypothetical protein